MRNLYTYEVFIKINEASYFDFENNDILTDKYITNFIETEDYTEQILHFFIDINNLGDEDENEVLNTDEFRKFIKTHLEDNLESAKVNIDNSIGYDNEISIYRVMRVEDNWLEHLESQGKRLGIFWSWEESAAKAHWGDYNKKRIAIIESSIDEKYVNWFDTFELNIHPYYLEEKEIRLFKNTPLIIKSITIDNEEVDISKFSDKIFYA